MKLAEALQERADLNRNIEQLKNRLSSNALVQEGEQPVECPENLKQELDASISRLSYLIARINRTKCLVAEAGRMPRGDSVSRIMDTRKGTCEVRVLKNCYAPTAYRCIVTDDCNDRVLTASARVGMGMLFQ